MSDEVDLEISRGDILRMSVDIVSAYIGANKITSQQIPEVIGAVFNTLGNLGVEATAKSQKPAVSVGRSIKPDYIVCLEDGRKLKMLKRHLRTSFGLTPGEYRAKWRLPPDYPMVAPNYAKKRSEFAKKIGLGHKSARKGKRGSSKK